VKQPSLFCQVVLVSNFIIYQIFSPKKWRNNGRFWSKLQGFINKNNHNIKKYPIFRSKLVYIPEKSVQSIDPWSNGMVTYIFTYISTYLDMYIDLYLYILTYVHRVCMYVHTRIYSYMHT
jgi:hypothetical protein